MHGRGEGRVEWIRNKGKSRGEGQMTGGNEWKDECIGGGEKGMREGEDQRRRGKGKEKHGRKVRGEGLRGW